MTELIEATLNGGRAVKESHILAWQVREDSRPLCVESAIIWLRLQGKWALAHVFRHTHDTGPSPDWTLSAVFDVYQSPRRDFSHAPTDAEIRQFLKDTWWEFTPKNGFRILDGAVCSNAWKQVAGCKPTVSFDPKTIGREESQRKPQIGQ